MRLSPLAIAFLLIAGPALAHTGEGTGGGFATGFVHPILGPDHVIAMIAVGLWGVFLGAPALWMLPIVFPLIMALGGAFGVIGIPVPAVETGIALSAVVLGLSIAFAWKPPLVVAALVVGLFAIFHGYAHGTEMPDASDAVSYALGFVIATGLLHLAGILFGFVGVSTPGRAALRAAGALIAVAGGAFLTGFA